jgi:hypothetical protein
MRQALSLQATFNTSWRTYLFPQSAFLSFSLHEQHSHSYLFPSLSFHHAHLPLFLNVETATKVMGQIEGVGQGTGVAATSCPRTYPFCSSAHPRLPAPVRTETTAAAVETAADAVVVSC